jgi:hypothetical protein
VKTLQVIDQPAGVAKTIADIFGMADESGVVRVMLDRELLGIFIRTDALGGDTASSQILPRRQAAQRRAARSAARGIRAGQAQKAASGTQS